MGALGRGQGQEINSRRKGSSFPVFSVISQQAFSGSDGSGKLPDELALDVIYREFCRVGGGKKVTDQDLVPRGIGLDGEKEG